MLQNRFISVAPMMSCTDRHDRYFLRLLSPHALLYTEMVTTGALIHGDYQRFLAFDPFEHPIALQLGGNVPQQLAYCAKLGEDFGYDEINLNVGCPSDRVKSGNFGACLMLEPEKVANSIAAMSAQVKIPVTVKCRIGVDQQDSYEELRYFIKIIAEAGCRAFIIHARKAWLTGLSPKENRDIPPLRYDIVYQIKRDFPDLTIVINGGIKTIHDIDQQLPFVDGVMIGREAYANPYLLAEIEKKYFSLPLVCPHDIVERYFPYIKKQLLANVKLSSMTRHILGIFQGQKGARQWRRHLSEHAHRSDAGVDIVQEALTRVERYV